MIKKTAIQKPKVLRVTGGLISLLVIVAMALLAINAIAAYSVFAGGLIGLIPNALYAWYAFRYSGARSTHLVVRSLYVGVAVKFILTAVLFAGVFITIKPLNVLAVFISFVGFQVLSFTGNALLIQRETK